MKSLWKFQIFYKTRKQGVRNQDAAKKQNTVILVYISEKETIAS